MPASPTDKTSPSTRGGCTRRFRRGCPSAALACGECTAGRIARTLTATPPGERRAMAGLAGYALPGIIVLTSVGAFLMCLLVIRYGFGGREMETDGDARRLLMIRVGHALAGVCFAGAALLAVVALPALTRPPALPAAPMAVPAPATPAAARDEQAQEIGRLRDALHQTQIEIDDKLAAIDSRVTNLTAAPRVGDVPARAPAPPSGKRSSRDEPPAAGSSGSRSAGARRAIDGG